MRKGRRCASRVPQSQPDRPADQQAGRPEQHARGGAEIGMFLQCQQREIECGMQRYRREQRQTPA